MISFKRSSKYGSLTIETQGEKALIMESSPAEVENENQEAIGFGFVGLPARKNFANGASFKMGQQVEVQVGIPNETGDSVSIRPGNLFKFCCRTSTEYQVAVLD